jgi:hypothetical protein
MAEHTPPRNAEEAREAARRSVQAAFSRAPEGPPVRTCPNCGEEAATWRAQCPACNKRYDRRLPWLSDRARWVLGVAGAIAAIAALWAILPGVFDAKQEKDAQAAREQAQRVATERARLIREQRPVRGRAHGLAALPKDAPASERLAQRRALVGQTEAAILTEARKRIATGELDGPVRKVSCGPLVRSPDNARDENDLSKRLGRYDCVAVKRDVVDENGKFLGLLGHPFVATVDFGRRSWVLCKDNKVPGERGTPLAKVRLDPSCVGAEGQKAVGNGYAAPDS